MRQREHYFDEPAPPMPDFAEIEAAVKYLNTPVISNSQRGTREAMNKQFSHRAGCVFCSSTFWGAQDFLRHVVGHEEYRAWVDFFYMSRREYDGLQHLKDELKEQIAADRRQLDQLEEVAERLSRKMAVKESQLKAEGEIDSNRLAFIVQGFKVDDEEQSYVPVKEDGELRGLRQKLLDVKSKIHALENQLSRKRFKARETEQRILRFQASEDTGRIAGGLAIPDCLLQVVSMPNMPEDVIPSGGNARPVYQLDMQRVQSRQRALTREPDSTSTSALHDAARRLQR